MPLNIIFLGVGATVEHLNLRKQGNEDDRVLAVDIKVVGMTDADVLNDLLGASPGEDLSYMFWSDPGDPHSPLVSAAIGDVSINSNWPGRVVHLGRHRTIADVKKIHIKPRGSHSLDLTASLSIEEPAQQLLDYLVKQIKEPIACRIESQPELDLSQAKGAA